MRVIQTNYTTPLQPLEVSEAPDGTCKSLIFQPRFSLLAMLISAGTSIFSDSLFLLLFSLVRGFGKQHIQWGKKVFSQPPIVQVLPLKKMIEACNFHHRYTSTMRDKINKKIQKIT